MAVTELSRSDLEQVQALQKDIGLLADRLATLLFKSQDIALVAGTHVSDLHITTSPTKGSAPTAERGHLRYIIKLIQDGRCIEMEDPPGTCRNC